MQHCNTLDDYSTGLTNNRLPAGALPESPLCATVIPAAAAARNCFQEILCSSAAKATTCSTFSAADMNRSIAAAMAISSPTSPRSNHLHNHNHHHHQQQQQQQQQYEQQYQQLVAGTNSRQIANSQVNLTSTFSGMSIVKHSNSNSFNKLRAAHHLRHKSIGRLNELSSLLPSPVTIGSSCSTGDRQQSTGDHYQQQQQQQDTSSTCSSAATSVQQQQLFAARGHQEVTAAAAAQKEQQQQQQQEPLEQQVSAPEVGGEIATMSATMQSIHSLSMQLNQQVAAAASRCDDDDNQVMGHSHQQPPVGSNGATNTSKLSKLVGKKALRAKELLLQNLGKADKTTDELFQMYEENFYKQQSQALRLQKEFKSYLSSLKGVQESSKSLNRCIQQSTGDYQSARHDLVCENLSQLEHLNEDLLEKLRQQVLVNISEYLSQFNELRDKIAKRRRKLIDYDSSRRVYEIMLSNINKKRQIHQQQSTGGLQGVRSFRSAFSLNNNSNNNNNNVVHSQRNEHQNSMSTNQLVDEARLLKLREQYNYCKIMYETINGELYEELPMLYEKKMKHLLMSLQNYFSLESQFHSNASKLFATASDVIEELPMSIVHASSTGVNRQQQHHHHHHQHHQQVVAPNAPPSTGVDEFNKTSATSGSSSGMGSSRADSSMESSSSLDNSTSGSPVEGRAAAPEEEDDDDDDDDNDYAEDDEEKPQLQQVMVTAAAASPPVELLVNAQQVSSADVEVASGKEPAMEEKPTEEAVGSSSPVVQLAEPQPGTSQDTCALAVDQPADDSIDIDSDSKALNEQQLAEAKNAEQATTEATEMHRDAQTSEHKCLYKVKTSYKYLAEDVDELCFEADEIIQVIEFEDGQEQEEGWLMGLREVNGQKGLFPANFTQPI